MAGFLPFLVGSVWAGPLLFELCSVHTGERVEELNDKGHLVRGQAYIETEDISQILELRDHPGCSILVLRNADQAAVIGTSRDLLCRIYGGDNCKWRKND